MTIGVLHLRDELQVNRSPGMLAIPFQRETGMSRNGNASGPDVELIDQR